MKKKLTVATVLILLLAVCLTMLVGCDEMFTKNEKRDAMQVVATVNYEGQSANIYKFELASQFNSNAAAWHSYYGLSYEYIANYFLQQLAQQKLLVLYARQRVPELMGVEATDDITELLTSSEINRAIKNTNDALLSSLKSIVEDSITEDRYNNASTNTDTSDDETDGEITDAVLVRFESNGGTEVERQRIQAGTKAQKPADPTKDGYTFYGWYQYSTFPEPDADADETANAGKGEFDFKTTVNNDITLYAKWVKYTPARNEMPEVEEEDDYDPDFDDPNAETLPKFISFEYKETLYDEFIDEDYVKTMNVPEGGNFEKILKDYINDGVSTLEGRLKTNLFKETVEEGYEYELNNQMESILVAKLQRLIHNSVTVSDDEVAREFARILDNNEGTFTGTNADSNYSSALTSKLDQTYYHLDTEKSYGFVINILLRLDDEKLETLKDLYKINPSNTKALITKRNKLISQIEVNVSNPKYSSSAIVEDGAGNEIELRDPMTDPKNPYNNVGKVDYDKSYQNEGGNNYNQILSFVRHENGECEIVFNATEHPAMAYLLETVPAFDVDGKVGIIHQIQNSFAEVTALVESGSLSREKGVYWLRELATKWLYLVGDDSGSLSDSSNNGGLGYLITPEGKASSYLSDFTDYARKLIENGTGSYATGSVSEDTFGIANAMGEFSGNGVAFVVADSFIGTGATDLSNAYAGVFVLLNSYTVWDKATYGDKLGADGVLPLDYVITYGKDDDDIKTIEQQLKDTLLSAKQANAYNLEVNTMGVEYMEQVEYNKDAYKSLWKSLD